MQLHLSIPTLSRALTLLGIIMIGCITGVLWPVNSFFLKFGIGFIGTLFAILFIASFVWGAITIYLWVCRPLIELFKFQKKKTFMQPHAMHDDEAPIIAARPERDEVTEATWIGVATLTGVVALWSLLVGWAISNGPNPLIAFSGWAAVGCAGVGLGLRVIAEAYDNDDVGTFSFLVLIAGTLSTVFVLLGLFASF